MTLVVDHDVPTGFKIDGSGEGREALGFALGRDMDSDRIFVTRVWEFIGDGVANGQIINKRE